MGEYCNYFGQGLDLSVTENFLKLRPCCLYKDDTLIPLENATKSSLLKDIQSFLTNSSQKNYKQDACQTCIEQDESNMPSLRQKSFHYSRQESKIHSLTIEADYRCNLACAMCNPQLSSTWYEQRRTHHASGINFDKSKFVHNKDYRYTREKIIDTVLNLDLSNLQWIKITGGEPLYSDSHLYLLKGIMEKCDPSQITVNYTTNFSFVPTQETLGVWANFKCIEYSGSIDGTDEQFHFLRWPYKWNKLISNVEKIKAVCGSNTHFKIEHTFTPLNIFYLDKMMGFITDTMQSNRFGHKTQFNLHRCFSSKLDLEYTPTKLRHLVYEKYGQQHKVSKLLQNTPTTVNNALVPYLDAISKARKLDWRAIFKDVEQYF